MRNEIHSEPILEILPDESDSDQIYDEENLREHLEIEEIGINESDLDYEEHCEDEEKKDASPAIRLLLRESMAESLRLLEESARTIDEWQDVIFEYDKRDENRMRRERRKEILRPNDYLEYGRQEHHTVIPVPYGNIPWRQLFSGNFIDIIYNCPHEIGQLMHKQYMTRVLNSLKPEHKEIIFYRIMHRWRMKRIAALRNQSERNVRKVKTTVMNKLEKLVFQELLRRQIEYLNEDEQRFLEKYDIVMDRLGNGATIFRLPVTDRGGNEKNVVLITEDLLRLILETGYQL